ncbi:MAG: hypothetical protein QM802_26520 [Agriterribacter sp.]
MKKHLLTVLFALYGVCLYAQYTPKKSLLYTCPVSITPLSLWDSDISASAGIEYRFHPSFSVRLAMDYIYGDYSEEHSRTSGLRIRHELRYYIAGNKLINSRRSKVWPYISVAFGNKRVNTRFSDWYYTSVNFDGFDTWRTYVTHNREWHFIARTGMQTAFGKKKRCLFDFSFGIGVTHNKVSYSFPDGEDLRSIVLPDYNITAPSGASFNKYSGRFTNLNFEACFGYRLFRK